MKLTWSWLLLVFACACFMCFDAIGGPGPVAQELVGTWHYTSMTSLKNGKPFGTVHFQHGQWTVTFSQNGAWGMKTPSPPNQHGLNGTYEIHGQDLKMKLADGKPYYTYQYKVEQEGKVLVLTTKEVIINAERE